MVVSSRGASYDAGSPTEGWDHAVPVLELILGTALGMTVEVITTSLTLAETVPALAPQLDRSRGELAAAHEAAAEAAGGSPPVAGLPRPRRARPAFPAYPACCARSARARSATSASTRMVVRRSPGSMSLVSAISDERTASCSTPNRARPASVMLTSDARRSPGTGERATSPADSSRSIRSTTDGPIMPSDLARSRCTMGPLALSVTSMVQSANVAPAVASAASSSALVARR